jgi:hypothetical protein
VLATHINWGAAGLIAAGAIIGGQLGARIGRKLPPWALRAVIICVGVAALVKPLPSRGFSADSANFCKILQQPSFQSHLLAHFLRMKATEFCRQARTPS